MMRLRQASASGAPRCANTGKRRSGPFCRLDPQTETLPGAMEDERMKTGLRVVFVGVLVLGGAVAQEALRPHGPLSAPPHLTQPSAPTVVHPNDPTADVREVREGLDLRWATPTSANTVPAPTSVDAGYVMSAPAVPLLIAVRMACRAFVRLAVRAFTSPSARASPRPR